MEERLKVAVIAGASHAIKLKMKNPQLSEEEILQEIASQMDNIIHQIDDD